MNSMTVRDTAKETAMDRRIIRVDIPPPHAGITAALRRAFAAYAEADSPEFDTLLARLS